MVILHLPLRDLDKTAPRRRTSRLCLFYACLYIVVPWLIVELADWPFDEDPFFVLPSVDEVCWQIYVDFFFVSVFSGSFYDCLVCSIDVLEVVHPLT